MPKTESVASGTGDPEYTLEEGVADSQHNSYNGFDQLTGVETENGSVSYTYFPSGLRASKTVGDVLTDYILDGGNVVLEMAYATVSAKYTRAINLVSSTGGGSTSYYLYNGHGDVVQLADYSGTVTKNYAYDAFGIEKNIDTNDTNPFRYTGEYFDRETGTYYLRARYYDPVIGRFAQEDSHWNIKNMVYGDDPLTLNEYTALPSMIAIMSSGNLYIYCVNNPTMYVDTTGELPYPGFIHDCVVGYVAAKYGFYVEQIIYYDFGWGRADLVSYSGKIWDVKRNKANQIAKGVKQVVKYTQNTWKNNPDVSLSVGGFIDPDSFVVEMPFQTYYVTYYYAGDGIIAYDYYTVTNWKKIANVAMGIVVIAGVTFVIVVTDGAAAPELIPVAEKALGGLI